MMKRLFAFVLSISLVAGNANKCMATGFPNGEECGNYQPAIDNSCAGPCVPGQGCPDSTGFIVYPRYECTQSANPNSNCSMVMPIEEVEPPCIASFTCVPDYNFTAAAIVGADIAVCVYSCQLCAPAPSYLNPACIGCVICVIGNAYWLGICTFISGCVIDANSIDSIYGNCKCFSFSLG